MSFTIHLADETVHEDRYADTGYQVSDAGVLRTFKLEDADTGWVVSGEYSPHAWVCVSGTRYKDSVVKLPGDDGEIFNGAYRP